MSLTGAGDILHPLKYSVQVRADWGSVWTTVPYLYPVQSSDCVAPSIGQAVFEFCYGRSKKCDQSTIQNYDPLSLRGYWVRIIDTAFNQLFVGQFDSEELIPKGATSSIPAGTQMLTAWGMCHTLDRSSIDYAQASNGAGTGTVYLDWVPDINKRAEAVQESMGVKTRKRGNRSAAVNTRGIYQFSDDGFEWSNLDVCNMLLTNYVEDGGPKFFMGGQSSILNTLHDSVQLEGKNVWQVLNELIDRRRGIGFFPIVNFDDTVTLFVYSILSADLTIDSVTIPANTNTTNIIADQRIEVLDCRIITSNSVRYDKVLIRGGRMLSCFTVSQADGTLENDWPTAFEASYAAGASGTSAYSSPTLSDGDKEDLNDKFRKCDIFQALYSRQSIPRTWDGTAGDGVGGTHSNVLPVCDESGVITFPAGADFTPLDKKIERALPFEQNQDYSGAVPTPGIEPVYRQPFACVQDESDGHSTAANWHMCHDPGEDLKDDGADASLEVHPSGMAFSIRATPNHIYGLGLFNPATAAFTGVAPVLKLSRTLATVAMYTDKMLLRSALRPGVITPLTVKSLRLRDAEYWYVAAGTVIDLNPDGTLQRVGAPMVLRDDRARMSERCAIAMAWFGQERRAVTLTIKGLSLLAPLGSLVNAVSAAGSTFQANTIVSSRMLDYRGVKSSIETQFIEFDWTEEN